MCADTADGSGLGHPTADYRLYAVLAHFFAISWSVPVGRLGVQDCCVSVVVLPTLGIAWP